jgi:ABC-type enterobactin transport system permease subunit
VYLSNAVFSLILLFLQQVEVKSSINYRIKNSCFCLYLGIAFSMPLIRRKKLLCAAEDIFTHNEKGPATMCIVQGAMFHFFTTSTAVWFGCSVFNITVAVLTFSTDNIIKRHSRVVFAIQCFLAIVVPGCFVGYTLGNSSYETGPLMFTCIAPSMSILFFAHVLPIQVICVCITTMVILLIRRIRQVCDRFFH